MIIDCAITNHSSPQLLNMQCGSSNMWNIQSSLLIVHSTQLLPFHQTLPSGIMAAILNCHCWFLTQLNCQPFTNLSPLVWWQQYSTTIAHFSLNPIIIHSPTTPLWYDGSNIQSPLPISHSTQLSTICQPLPSGNMAAILNHHCWFFTELTPFW